MLDDMVRPVDPDAERALVAHVLSLSTSDKSVLRQVQPADFDDGMFGHVWESARAVHERGEKVTPRSVLAEAGKAKDSPLAQKMKLVSGTPVAAHAVYAAAARVTEQAKMRRLLNGLAIAHERAQFADDYSEAFHFASEALAGMEGATTPKDVSTFAEALTRWQERLDSDADQARVFPTPWDGFNSETSGGLHAGRSYVIGGRPGEGKSLAGANLVAHAAEHGHVGIIFSVEMGEHEVVSRMLAAGADAEYGQITRRQIDQWNYDKIRGYIATHRQMPLYIVDKADITMDYIVSRCRALKRNHGLDVVFVDYLQLLQTTDSQASRERQIAQISRSLKILSRELDCAVVTACQLNRNSANESRPPRLSDLRESGAIEQDADVVVLLHHIVHKAADGKPEHSGELDLIVAKNRTGPTVSVRQYWAGHKAAIY